MNNKLINVLAFTIGAAIGSVVTWKIVKTKYEQIANDEIESVKEVFSKREVKSEKNEPKKFVQEESKPSTNEKPDLKNYAEMVGVLGYSKNEEKGDEDSMKKRKPYVITPEEFGEADGYGTESLNYYADGVLTDDWDNVIEDVDYIVGEESLTHFGEYEDDSVFVRNDELEMEYEILLDERNFSDVVNRPMGPVELEEDDA